MIHWTWVLSVILTGEQTWKFLGVIDDLLFACALMKFFLRKEVTMTIFIVAAVKRAIVSVIQIWTVHICESISIGTLTRDEAAEKMFRVKFHKSVAPSMEIEFAMNVNQWAAKSPCAFNASLQGYQSHHNHAQLSSRQWHKSVLSESQLSHRQRAQISDLYLWDANKFAVCFLFSSSFHFRFNTNIDNITRH